MFLAVGFAICKNGYGGQPFSSVLSLPKKVTHHYITHVKVHSWTRTACLTHGHRK